MIAKIGLQDAVDHPFPFQTGHNPVIVGPDVIHLRMRGCLGKGVIVFFRFQRLGQNMELPEVPAGLLLHHDADGVERVMVSSDFYQPDDNPVVASIEKIQKETDWKPEVSLSELVKMMVSAEMVNYSHSAISL